MRRQSGDSITDIRLTAIDGNPFTLEQLKGKRFMLSFLRFASCPFCNLRVHELTRRFSEFGGNFTIVAVFDSPLDNLQRHAVRHQPPFPILADGNQTYYREYGIERSVLGVLKGMITRMPSLLYAMFVKGYLPLRIQGNMTTLPADFLVDESGIIQVAHYGRDEGDHLSFDQVKAFSLKENKAG